ncbi:MAG: hypothetical protein A3H57_00930 [Candidatus Taylorbacteria bacterium RIFCSPLOWO2_02_FULL_43_11]|uniref:Aminopeptidase n=1 Tax=Candidatus Taylorbacteria bacterium RIFCSPHIGHO2_02_FULL_43_32b TaxID=1802306 RepID=A0A1G2MJF1_9BACT|nr:MAG: hypothetical protein A2743_03975 [Candidatus Taylorbacteria bacterium RIFCSPHIGHO2_01_FULL_43_47]OHA23997.1 MAG: hypothetical protein A3C72_02535 [Candidatus Taylorbacteria bacterium RIFCSPHIGHO2_02_FULL_43_32b]OHA31014.1 MAG: hypothetical protein A3B08_03040 [Candidatus Taylorbacteria bacterium RIFCSPLOWO2_01_FULL_43_44]OHA37697.1 MAG: hypothetical protein A3H57_00930 [Candidatus Taylorbacteria bacterium RIFCSPLOWO2_02_FULL_43_11]
MSKTKHERLISWISPSQYQITIHPDFSDHTFKGEETIFLTLRKASRSVVLHSANLKLSGVFFVSEGKNERIDSSKIVYNKKEETVSVLFARMVQKGKGKLFLKFNGQLSDDMRGFYKSRYTIGNEEHFIATTQFESTDARRAFPCVDEPEAKAIFDVTMIVPNDHDAISNTIPIGESPHESGYKVVKFAPTPIMSTYLLAFISGKFESIEGKNKDGVLVRVFTTPGKKKQAEFALEVAKKSLEFYTEYFDTPYPLPVLDMIAAPDFAAGAMENWGAVTYRESALLVDSDHTATEAKQWVALVIAHELAHQWFGNLVTMKWWTDLWLNEGFASYIEYLAVDHIFPEWEIWKQFVSSDLSAALRLDALKTTHPIEVPVQHPNEIAEIFDAVSYSKGASVIRMLANYLGEKDFKKGLQNYLKKHAYQNAETKDLWDALSLASHKPVGKIMEKWTKKPGYPLISVHRKNGKTELSQGRFMSSALSRKTTKDNTLWNVPMVYGQNGKVKTFLLTGKRQVLSDFKEGHKLNFGEAGLYRVDYPEAYLKSFFQKIEEKKLSPADRLGLLRDSFALAESGQSPTTLALSMLEAYRSEEEYVVWREIAHGLGKVSSVFAGSKVDEYLKNLRLSVFSPVARRFGWHSEAGEPHSAPMLRDMLLFQAAAAGDFDIIAKAKRLFEIYLKGGEAPEKDVRSAVYFIVAREGGVREFDELKKLYINAKLPDEKDRLGHALGLSKDKKVLESALSFALTKHVRPQDLTDIYGSVCRNYFGRELSWTFLKKNWKKLISIYGPGGHRTPRLVEPLSVFSDAKYANEIESFFKTKKVGVERTVTQVCERIRSNANWKKNEEKPIWQWLNKYRNI